jgi:hypothetical protein
MSRIKHVYRSFMTFLSSRMSDSQWDTLFIKIDAAAERIAFLLGPLLFIGCMALISFVTFSYFYDVWPSLYTQYTISSSSSSLIWQPYVITAFGLCILFNIFWNYICCVFVRPPIIPNPMPADIQQTLAYDPEISIHSHVPYRYCNTCKNIKPMRTHHCTLCRCCVPKMDHHVCFQSYRSLRARLVHRLIL